MISQAYRNARGGQTGVRRYRSLSFPESGGKAAGVAAWANRTMPDYSRSEMYKAQIAQSKPEA
jgi:hypothetical protein